MNRIQRMLVGIAIGDAFGADYEWDSAEEIRRRLKPDRYADGIGTYTDDTQMSIAVAEQILSGEPFTRENLAERFVACFRRDPRKGYMQGFFGILEKARDGKDLLARLNPHSIRNGAAMRSVPLGIIPDISTLIGDATINARITHNTTAGVSSSRGVALASHYVFHGKGSLPEIIDFCLDHRDALDAATAEHLERVRALDAEDRAVLCGEDYASMGIPCDGRLTFGAAVYLAKHATDDPHALLQHAVCLGGDTDTVASIAFGIVAPALDLEKLPPALISDLENGPFGRDYLLALGEKYGDPTRTAPH